MKALKRRNFRLFPGRLPQSWMALSHGAQGMAFHWWRVFEDEPVRIPVERLAAALGLQPEVRRSVQKWLAEMLRDGALTRSPDGALRMATIAPDADDTRPREYVPRRQVFVRDGWTCVYCGSPVCERTGHVDHVLPWSRGGSNEMSNLVAACAECNLKKGAKTPREWLS